MINLEDSNFSDDLNESDLISLSRLAKEMSKGVEECRIKKIHLSMVNIPYLLGGGFFYCENCLTYGEFYKS